MTAGAGATIIVSAVLVFKPVDFSRPFARVPNCRLLVQVESCGLAVNSWLYRSFSAASVAQTDVAGLWGRLGVENHVGLLLSYRGLPLPLLTFAAAYFCQRLCSYIYIYTIFAFANTRP